MFPFMFSNKLMRHMRITDKSERCEVQSQSICREGNTGQTHPHKTDFIAND